MPEVITGLALLLLFVAIEVERGFWTVTIAHTTLTMGFVTVIVQARLIGFDRSLEEAAMDLGCPPFRTFMTVTLPLIAPAIAAGWVLAFMLSLDDLVIANFVTGPRRGHAADPDLFGGTPWRAAGDQRGVHDHHRRGRARHRCGVAADEVLRRAAGLDRRAAISRPSMPMRGRGGRNRYITSHTPAR